MNVSRSLTNIPSMMDRRFPSIWNGHDEWIVLKDARVSRDGRPGRLLFLDKGDDSYRHNRYITCWVPDDDGTREDEEFNGWQDGRAFRRFRDAEKDFHRRLRSGD